MNSTSPTTDYMSKTLRRALVFQGGHHPHKAILKMYPTHVFFQVWKYTLNMYLKYSFPTLNNSFLRNLDSYITSVTHEKTTLIYVFHFAKIISTLKYKWLPQGSKRTIPAVGKKDMMQLTLLINLHNIYNSFVTINTCTLLKGAKIQKLLN